MSLNNADLRFFKKRVPGVDFTDAYWSFYDATGGKDAAFVPPSLKNVIYYGISFRSGGGLAEMSMHWEDQYPYLNTYMDAAILLSSPTHRKLAEALMKYKKAGPTREQFSKLLISLGFEDNSDGQPESRDCPR